MSNFTFTAGTIVDIVIVIIAISSIVIGAKRGLLKSILSVAVVLVAVLAAYVISGPLADPVTDWAYPKVEKSFATVAGIDLETLREKADALFKNLSKKDMESLQDIDPEKAESIQVLPEGIKKAAVAAGLDLEKIEKALGDNLGKFLYQLQKTVDEKLNHPDGTKDENASIVESAGKALVHPIVRAVLGILLFAVLFIVLKLVVFFIDKIVDKTPGVKTVNAAGGAVLAFAEFAVVVYVLVFICVRFGLTKYTGDYTAASIIFGFLSRFVPTPL